MNEPMDGGTSPTRPLDTDRLGRVRILDPKGAGKGQGLQPAPDAPGDTWKLSPEAEAVVEKLKKRDAAVRAHESAHLGAGGAVVKGGVTFDYVQGPDGISYAVGGEVSVDTSPVPGNPQATLAKAEAIRAAALAPMDPSGRDLSVAAGASAMAALAASALADVASAQAVAQVPVRRLPVQPIQGPTQGRVASPSVSVAVPLPPPPPLPQAPPEVQAVFQPGAYLDYHV